MARRFIANKYSGFAAYTRKTWLILRRIGLEQGFHVRVGVPGAEPSLHTVVQPVFIPPEFLGHFRRQLLDEILVTLEYRIDVAGVDLSIQGEQERRSAVDHDFDRAAGRKRSAAKLAQRILQC